FSEGGDGQAGEQQRRRGPGAAALYATPDLAGTEVAVDISAGERGKPAAAVTIAAGDRTVSVDVIVNEHRIGRRTGRARDRGVEDQQTFLTPPAVVAAAAAGRLEVHLFFGALADVGDQEVMGLPVEGDAPGIAQAERPDFGPRAG